MHRKAILPIYNSASSFYIKGGTWYERFNRAVYQNKKDIRGVPPHAHQLKDRNSTVFH